MSSRPEFDPYRPTLMSTGVLGYLGACPVCGGKGARSQQWCKDCGGGGLAKVARLFRVRVPPGQDIPPPPPFSTPNDQKG